jgi:hypothetical protein
MFTPFNRFNVQILSWNSLISDIWIKSIASRGTKQTYAYISVTAPDVDGGIHFRTSLNQVRGGGGTPAEGISLL